MNNPHKNWQEFLINEAGLNKIRQDMSDYDTAFITAFRGDINDTSVCLYIPLTSKEIKERTRIGRKGVFNRKNNKELSAYLLSQGYGIKNVQGSYIENFETPKAVEVAEESFFVSNRKDDPDFALEIARLGEDFDQDSVLIVEKGAQNAYLLGT